MIKVQLPQGTGPIKKSRSYKSMTENQKKIYDLVYDPINGPLFFAENCCYVNRNGIEHYVPFDYQREMLFNMHNYKNLISLFSRQNGKCCLGKSMVYVKNKKTGEAIKISIGEFFEMIKNNKGVGYLVDKKFVETFDVNDWEVFTDTGWKDITKVHKTIPYQVWEIHTENHLLKCADKHLVFDESMFPTYVEELKIGDKIWCENGLETVSEIIVLDDWENMYDLELSDENHRYYTDGILSHNTITSAIYLLWFATVNDNKEILVCAQSKDAAMENLSKIRFTYEYCPDFLKKGLVSDNKSTLIFDNGSRIVVRPSTIKAPRGLSPALVYCDEFAFIGSQDSADKALAKQEEFYGALSPTLSATQGKLFITSTPISETDLFYRLWNGGLKKTNDEGLLLPKDYIITINDVPYRDFHLFKSEKEADAYVRSLRNKERDLFDKKHQRKFRVIEKEPSGNNSFQTQLVKWDACPLKDKKWAEEEMKRVGESKFSKEYNCLTGDSKIKILDEQGFIRNISLETLYNYY